MAEAFLSALVTRRSVYQLSNDSTISDQRIEEIIKHVLSVAPSAFNTQSTRIVVLHKDQHRKLWDIVKASVAPLVSGEQATMTNKKIESFQSAYATVLFFEDPSPYEPLAAFKLYADKFESWRDQTNGMHQILVWTALALEGLGSNIQHYNPLIDTEVKKTWGIEQNWGLLAQLVIGKPIGDAPAHKDKKPIGDRYKIIS